MSNDNIDQNIRDAFDEYEFEYRPEHWEALSRKLDSSPGRNSLLFLAFLKGKTGVAACAASLLCLLGAYWIWNQVGLKPAPGIAVTAPPPAAVSPAADQPGPTTTTALTATDAAPAVTAALPAATPARHNLASVSRSSRSLQAITGNNNSTAEVFLAQADTQHQAPATVLPQAAQPVQTAATTDDQKQDKKLEPVNFAYPGADFDLKMKQDQDAHTALGLTGGYNYGVANSGFALGVNAKRMLGKHLYMEGDLAYIQNNNPSATSNMSSVQYNAVKDVFAAPNMAASVNKIDRSMINRLAYIQFSPGLGYKLSSKFQLGLGADIQQMLQQEKDMVIYMPDKEELKTLPSTDIGLVGKTQYNINQKLRAGILYREGVQAAFDNKYFNRRYVQFTFNYMLFQR